jgi:spermidine/putrescine transport system ATP-binding protein
MAETHAAAAPEPIPRRAPGPEGDPAAGRGAQGNAVSDVPAIELTGVSKDFHVHGEVVTAVKGIDLAIREGEFFSLLGPSGCGKTTTMRMIAGFEDCTAGSVYLYGRDVTGVPPNRRDVNMVFQSYALFPHMNVFENVAFGLRRRRIPASEIARRVREMLEIVDLGGRDKRRPRELSGGQQQRVALARALVNRPRALLLDEPLGALDLKLRQAMQVELKRIQREVGITFVYVTHDQGEALTMSDRIAVMNDGVIEHLGTPREIYEHPASRFVAGFIGTSNLLTGKVSGVTGGSAIIEVSPGERIVVPMGRHTFSLGDDIELTVRPEKISLSVRQPDDDGQDRCLLRGKVTEVVYLGTATNFNITTSTGAEVVVFIQNAASIDDAADTVTAVQRDDAVWLSWQPRYSYAIGSSTS